MAHRGTLTFRVRCAVGHRPSTVPYMATQLPDSDLLRVSRWCDEKVPDFARDQVRMQYQVRAANVTLVERRVPWDAMDTPFGDEWTAQPVAQLRYDGGTWRLWWPDRNTRWHLVEDVPASDSVVPLLEALDDPRRALLG